MHAIGITKRVEHPYEEGQWIEIRRLPGKKLKKAREARETEAYAKMRAAGGDLLKNLPSRCRRGCGEEKHAGACPPPEERVDASAADAAEQYDTDTLLYAGIVAWSSDLKVTPANIDELDEPTIEWVKRELIEYNRAPSEEEQGNLTKPSGAS